METRKILVVVMIFVALISVMLAAGCVSQPTTTIKSEREVGEAVTNISSDVQEVSEILTDIDRKFG